MKTSQITRSQIITLSNTAYQAENYAFAKKVLILWLKTYPNDLWIQYRLAIILFKLGSKDDAIRLCEIIVKRDPEFIEVWSLLAAIYPKMSDGKKNAIQRVKLLRNFQQHDAAQNRKQGFASLLGKAKQTEEVDLDAIDDFDILAAIRIAKNMRSDQDLSSIYRLLKIYIRRWPGAVQFKLLLGDVLNRMGRTEEGIRMMHDTLENDVTGQVAGRLWGKENAYRNLWLDPDLLSVDISSLSVPEKIARQAKLDRAVEFSYAPEPAAAASESFSDKLPEKQKPIIETRLAAEPAFAANLSPDKNAHSQQNPSEATLSGQSGEIAPVPPRKNEKKAEVKSSLFPLKGLFRNIFTGKIGKAPETDAEPIKEYVYKLNIEDADERFPVYVVLSTVAGLTAKYGKNNKDFIDQEMRSIVDAIENREGWNAMVYYPDEFQSGNSVMDAESIRNALIRLDETLAGKGSMIGALLIVGGHEVVPFFTLTNPAMDDDLKIHSDIPYASTDNVNYYDQQWQVGRIPGDNSNDPGLILSQLRAIQNHHIKKFSGSLNAEKNRNAVKTQFLSRIAKTVKSAKSFGYSCAAWQRPSVAIYKNLTDAANLLLSPATMASNFPIGRLEDADYAYFNLHGIKGQPNWYGQKDSKDTSSIPMIPVALEINTVQNITKTPKIVFAENCYGSEVVNRNESNALSLHMLGKQTHVFIGSTVIAYGAINLPLTAADLLANLFWKHLMTNVSCGEAFRRARKNMATEIESTSGGLDGEIQKTLLSFVFYGDPLYTIDEDADITDRMQRAKTPRNYELVREKLDSKVAIDFTMAKQIYDEVKERYKLEDVSDEFSTFSIQKQIMNNKAGLDPDVVERNQNYVIVYTKDNRVGNMLDRQITRVTVSKEGKIIKVSFSR